jgi:thioredoxin reductase
MAPCAMNVRARAAALASRAPALRVGGARTAARKQINTKLAVEGPRVRGPASQRAVHVLATRDGEKLGRKLRVAVVGGGPSGACAADDLAKGGVEVFMFERKMDNCKVRRLRSRGGAVTW